MVLNKTCLCCSSTTELNTRMQVTVESKEYEIVLCSQHEETTAKKAREIVAAKLKEYADLMEKLKSFGMNAEDCEISAGGIAIPKAIEEPAPATPAEPTPADNPTGVKVIVAKKRPQAAPMQTQLAPTMIRSDNFTVNPNRTMAGAVKGIASEVNLEGRSSINVQSFIEADIAKSRQTGALSESAPKPMSKIAESQTVRGRGGAPMTIPRRIKHNIGGETFINVVDTGGDRTIQDRTKALAAEDGWGKDPFRYRKGYDVTPCSLCNGTGNTSINNEVCPKCKGTGVLNKGWAG